MAGIQLRVTPEEMERKAGEISGQIDAVEKNWNNLCDTVKASRTYWEGDAGDRNRKFLEDITRDAQSVLSRLSEHPDDLRRMAGIYTEAENTATELVNTLPDNVIQ